MLSSITNIIVQNLQKRMKFFKESSYKTKNHRIMKNYKWKFKMDEMIFAAQKILCSKTKTRC